MEFLFAFLCLGIMTIFIYYENKERYGLAVLLKGLASLTFVIFGFMCATMCKDQQFAKMVKIGLILGMVADILLNLRHVFKKEGKIIFLVGILVFMAGHIMYLCALIPNCSNLIVPMIAGIALTALIIFWIFKKIEAPAAFKIFGIFYIGAIVLMNCFAVTNLIENPCARNTVFMIGAISFLISDIVLILNTFGKEEKFSLRVTNLSLYYIGQLLIAFCLCL